MSKDRKAAATHLERGLREMFKVGSRESRLAVVQSQMVVDHLRAAHPELEVELVTMKTTGDVILDRRLDQVGGKGLFVKELDIALMERRTDCSVHSLKDLPMEVPAELPVLCYSRREDPRDVLVFPAGADSRDESLPIGTSSPRRELQLRRLFPDAAFESIRGNLQTRLRKLDEGQFGAIVLAAAGLKRLGLGERIGMYLPVEDVIPSAGQGILAVQGRTDTDPALFDGFADGEAAIAARAERAFVRRLDGGCSSPIAAHAVIEGDAVTLLGLYYDEATGAARRGRIEGRAADAETIAAELADDLRAGGGDPL